MDMTQTKNDDDGKKIADLCIKLGIFMYPIKGHCHEDAFVQEHGQACLDKYFVAYDAIEEVEWLMAQVENAVLLYSTAEEGYAAVYSELVEKGLL